MKYVFDIDGTLTPSRLPIDPEFEKFFLEWMEGKEVYLVTGSDKDKTMEQVGEKIWTNATKVYQSCGNYSDILFLGSLYAYLIFPQKH